MPRSPKLKVTAGEQFGHLVVTDPDARNEAGRRSARCTCSCGAETVVAISKLVSGHTASCGQHSPKNYKHGMTKHPSFKRWFAMVARCTNPSYDRYADYGGRGIKVHAPWLDPAAFLTWLDANLGPCPRGMTLDRIDNDRGYEPGNLRWATRAAQANNRRPHRPRRT